MMMPRAERPRKIVAGRARTLLLAGLALVSTAPRVEAQLPCSAGGIRGTLDQANQTSVGDPPGGFCNNNITGSEDCGGNVGKVEFILELEGTEVDLVCTSSEGILCIMADDCQNPVLGRRVSDQRVELQGAVAATNLKIVIADDVAQTLCNASAQITISCSGYFGGEVLFASSFERAFEEDGWAVDNCTDCNLFAGVLGGKQSLFTHQDGFRARAGEHLAVFKGSPGADFDLVLWRKSGARWRKVASWAAVAPGQRLEHRGTEGVYRWEVRVGRGHGEFELRTDFPGRADPRGGELEP